MEIQNDTDQAVGYTIDVGGDRPSWAESEGGPSEVGRLSPAGTPHDCSDMPVVGVVRVRFLVSLTGRVDSPPAGDGDRVTLVRLESGVYQAEVEPLPARSTRAG